jgi:hypothetical protein
VRPVEDRSSWSGAGVALPTAEKLGQDLPNHKG